MDFYLVRTKVRGSENLSLAHVPKRPLLSRWSFLVYYTSFILVTLPLTPLIWTTIRRWIGRSAATILIIVLFLAAILFAFKVIRVLIKRNQWNWWRGSVLVACFLIFFQFFRFVDTPVEQIHFFEYGFLSFLACRCAESTWPRLEYWLLRFAVWGFAVVFGTLDEWIQYMLPNRVGDIRDVGLNALAALFGLVIVSLLKNPLPCKKSSTTKT